MLVVAIDENEVHHLGMLLEQVFKDARRQMVSICINPSGVSGEGLSRVDEYAFFCSLGGVKPVSTTDDMLSEGAETEKFKIEWESLLRRGNAWYRKSGQNLCYPVAAECQSRTRSWVSANRLPAPTNRSASVACKAVVAHGQSARTASLGIWRVEGATLMELAKRGYAYVSSRDDARDTWTIKYLMSGAIKAIEHGRIEVIGRGSRGQVLLKTAVALRTTRRPCGTAAGTPLAARVAHSCSRRSSESATCFRFPNRCTRSEMR